LIATQLFDHSKMKEDAMSLKFRIAAIAAVTLLATTAFADGMKIMVDDSYARSAGPKAKTGAAFMMLKNHGTEADRLIGVASTVAKRTELHTHKENDSGLMQMLEVTEGFEIPAGGMHVLKRGGDHVMLMGLEQGFAQGSEIELVLTFEKAGEMTVMVPVDNDRKPQAGTHGGHSGHGTHTN
jgi:copper(I)-binding protein